MKLCLNCLTELFDRDTSCCTCGSDTLLTNDELNKIRQEIKTSSGKSLEKLLDDTKYQKVQEYILLKQNRDEKYPEFIKYENIKGQVNPSYSTVPKTSAPEVICPYCKSTNTKKITSTEKAVNIALFGIFGNKRKHQWHCNNCNSDF